MNDLPNMDVLAKMYIRMRNKKQEITKQLEEEVGAIDAQMKEVAAAMREVLQTTGGTSMKTDHGTVYLTRKDKYYPMDWDAFGNWVIAKGEISLLEKRVAQSNMKQWMTDNPTDPPPGLQCESEITVTVRKA